MRYFNTKKTTESFAVIALGLSFVCMVYAGSVEGEKNLAALKPVEINLEQLVKQAAIGEIAAPRIGSPPYRISPDGKLYVLPATGSITFNFRTGDSAVNIAGDHVEPAVTLYNPGLSDSRDSAESHGLNTLACIGNKVRVINGDAKGAIGLVVGKHGGSEHVMVDFPDNKVFDKFVIGDEMQVYTWGVGIELTNVEEVTPMNISPQLIDALTQAGMGVTEEGKLHIGVTHKVPARIMGSGLGTDQAYSGDYDIQLFDEGTVKEFNLGTLQFGDIIAIMDADNTFGRIYRKGAITIGVISHSTSKIAGHGPGVTTIFSSAKGNIELELKPDSNLAKLLKIRR
jgi:hypothetical protein